MISNDIDLSYLDGIKFPSVRNSYNDLAAFNAYEVDVSAPNRSAVGYISHMFINGSSAAITDECSGITYYKTTMLLLINSTSLSSEIKSIPESEAVICISGDFSLVVNGYGTVTYNGVAYSFIQGMYLTYSPVSTGYKKILSNSITSRTFKLVSINYDTMYICSERVLSIDKEVNTARYGKYNTPYNQSVVTTVNLPETKSTDTLFAKFVSNGHERCFIAFSNLSICRQITPSRNLVNLGAFNPVTEIDFSESYRFVYILTDYKSMLRKRANIYTFNFSGTLI